MPTASSTLGWTLANWGTAPTTWVSADCTPAPQIYYAEPDDADIPELFASCPSTAYDSCLPRPSNTDLLDDYLSNQRNVPYWSPGANCPSGWKSVGSAARTGSAEDVTSSGIFTIGALATGRWELDDILDDDYIQLGLHDAFGALLDPSETAVACCPSSMTPARNGLCYSTLPTPSSSITAACIADYSNANGNLEFTSTSWVIDGTTRSGTIAVPTVTVPRTPESTRTRSIDADDRDELVVASLQVPVYVVRREGDRQGGAGNSSSGGSDGSGSSNGSDAASETDTNTNAAGALRLGRTSTKAWGSVGGMVGVLAASFLVGFALVVPW
ncbi:uncharacterized protein DSM5745_07889 [Aspergillus mulundensis]|uniref:Uncharacterized protein n=1 Tax=Aspergillus mulundensis TaxID=1810919 RepID=A0A3D8RFA3_9EURO|nr:Uncharacterized protein DSM5745_07889 [Aspergillus mulundensis]RDW72717.1 Uncharacterized protein DSM5745_07889 [Aspergillus mulundensis]